MTLGRFRIRRTIPVMLAAASLLAGTSFLASSAAEAHTTAHVTHASAHPSALVSSVSSHAKVMTVKQTLAYWTRARMRAAKPISVITVSPKASRGVAVSARPAGKPGRVAGGLPAGVHAPAAAASPMASPSSLASPQTLQFTYPFPYDIYYVLPGLYQVFPYQLNGKLFFTNDGGDYVCSATSVASSSGTTDEDEIWTAGHCAANTNGTHEWDSSAIFIPAYNGDRTGSSLDPYGEFVYTGDGETTSAWLNNGDFSEDEAAMIVGDSTTTGKTLGNAVGYAGFAWNEPVDEQFSAIGYPAASPYNGNIMWQDWGATGGQVCFSGEADSVCPIGIGSPMTGGSSGGAWWIDWDVYSPNYIDGHNDFKLTSPSQPLAMYSPYQDTLSNEVRCFGASSC
jgi:hypothetical protein